MSVLQINTISDNAKYLGVKVMSPLISVVNFTEEVGEVPNKMRNFGIYSLILKGKNCGEVRYGRQKYDYTADALVCTAPGQIIGSNEQGFFKPQGNALFFHPDLLLGTSLKETIKKYSFFSYQSHEALHLSQEERDEIITFFERLRQMILTQKGNKELVEIITLLLEKCLQFYDRQFSTRTQINQDILSRFEVLLEYFYDENEPTTLPNVKYFADNLFLSSNYFGDLIKKETGKTPKDYIQIKIIDLAKTQLICTDKNINEIAYQLGFDYPHYFSRLFKKIVGRTPNEFRKVNR